MNPGNSSRMSGAELPLDLAHALAPVQAVKLSGEPVRLGTFWENQPAAIFFLRHFG